MSNKVIVPIDGSDNSMRALDIAVDLARQRGLDIELVHVIPPGGVPEGLRAWAAIEHVHEMPQWLYDDALARNVLDAAQRKIPADAGIKVEQYVETGEPAKVIIDMSKASRADMIVIGSRGLSDFSGLVFGSVAHKVAHGASCRVVSVT